MAPSRRADKWSLIRRATFGLAGLPPTPEEVAAFLADKSPEAFAKVVDRLLGSPRYGECWGRHWLDVARYADTKGYVFEEERRFPYSYTYRDYVIRSLNEDLSFDRFLIEQLAGDLLPLGEDKRPLAALGFLTLGRRFLNNQHDIIDDRIDVVSRGMMGLTVACARCHDHKCDDPIPAKDYYSLYGIFGSCSEPAEKPLLGDQARPAAYAEYWRNVKSARKNSGSSRKQSKPKHWLNSASKRANTCWPPTTPSNSLTRPKLKAWPGNASSMPAWCDAGFRAWKTGANSLIPSSLLGLPSRPCLKTNSRPKLRHWPPNSPPTRMPRLR